MIEEAVVAIDSLSERERRQRESKYARRNRMRYIDGLLNELEMLNLADQVDIPAAISNAVDKLVSESELETELRADSILNAMDLLYEVQDSLMYNQIEDE